MGLRTSLREVSVKGYMTQIICQQKLIYIRVQESQERRVISPPESTIIPTQGIPHLTLPHTHLHTQTDLCLCWILTLDSCKCIHKSHSSHTHRKLVCVSPFNLQFHPICKLFKSVNEKMFQKVSK